MISRSPAPVLVLSLLCAVHSPAGARTWRVETDGSGDTTLVQGGIGLASQGDTVLVGPGTYNEDIDFLGKDIVLLAKGGPDVTILDGTGQDSSVVVFRDNETRNAVLEGFTITNGQGSPLGTGGTRGGGIFVFHGSPTIRGNTITSNHAEWGGGAWGGKEDDTLQPWPQPEPAFEENVFENNIAVRGGGGLDLESSRALVQANVFRGNSLELEGDGGGLRVDLRRDQGHAWIRNNQFWSNIATDQGGGLFAYMTNSAEAVEIEGNLFVSNEAHGIGPSGSGFGTGGGIGAYEISGFIRHNTLVGNIGLPPAYCTGGGLRLYNTTLSLDVSDNIIALNSGCGIVCRGNGTATFGRNLLWENAGTDLESCPATWSNLVISGDPQFCDAGLGDYRVAASSPALTGPTVLGAFSQPGCGPVSALHTTWGSIKARFKSK